MPSHPFYRLPTAGNDTLTSSSGNDSLFGYLGNDRLYGGLGEDWFFEGLYRWDYDSAGIFFESDEYEFGAGNDTYDGGAGIDGIYMGGVGRDLVLDWNANSVGDGTETDILVSVEIVVLGYGNDRIVHFRPDTGVDGYDGYDLIDLSAVTEAVRFGFDANEVLVGSTGFGAWNIEDAIGSLTRPNMFIGTGIDNYFYGGREDDTLWGGGGLDRLEGRAGNDEFQVRDGGESVYGGTGRDLLVVGSSTVLGAVLADLKQGIWTYEGRTADCLGMETIQTGGGNDTVVGAGRATLGGGDDTFIATRFPGAVHGEGGRDTVDLSGIKASITVSADFQTVSNGVDTFNMTRIEVVIGSRAFANTISGGSDSDGITGGNRADSLSGGSGSDSIVGLAGDDTILGGYGSEWIDAGAGNDSISDIDISQSTFSTIYGGGGDDWIECYGEVYGGDGNDEIRQGARTLGKAGFIYGGGGDDTVSGQMGGKYFGDEGNDLLNGTGKLYGGADNDTVIGQTAYGGDGNDSLVALHLGYGGDGDDTITSRSAIVVSAGSGNDLVKVVYLPALGGVYAGGSGSDRIQFGVLAWGTDVSGFEEVVGSQFDDRLRIVGARTATLGLGNDYAVVELHRTAVSAGQGDDSLQLSGKGEARADSGNDLLSLSSDGINAYGGDGNDQFLIDAVPDEEGETALRTYGGSDDDEFLLDHGYGYHFGGDGNDVIRQAREVEAEYATSRYFGGSGDDQVVLASSFDLVDLGDGGDRLELVAPIDATGDVLISGRIRGGLGRDIYDLTKQAALVDIRILDFDLSEDRIRSWAGGDRDDFVITDDGGDAVIFVPRPDPVPDGGDASLGQRITLVGISADDLRDVVFL